MPGGIFCIENFSADLRNRETVRPILEFLEQREAARVLHRPVETHRELRHYLSRFAGLRDYFEQNPPPGTRFASLRRSTLAATYASPAP